MEELSVKIRLVTCMIPRMSEFFDIDRLRGCKRRQTCLGQGKDAAETMDILYLNYPEPGPIAIGIKKPGLPHSGSRVGSKDQGKLSGSIGQERGSD